MSGASEAHIVIETNLVGLLYGARGKRNCNPFTSTMAVHAPATGGYFCSDVVVVCGQPEYKPDVIWRAPESQCIRTDKDFRGTPELVVEVLSPGTAQRDKTDKFALYEQHGAHEYWLVDPRDNLIEVYTRQGTGFHRLGAFKAGQTFQSPVLADAAIAVKEIFSRL